jgi:hypothetical protein
VLCRPAPGFAQEEKAMKSTTPGLLRRIVAALAALSMTALATMLAPPPAEAQEAADPFFAVSPVEPADHMWGQGWLPESEVQVEIDDPAVGDSVDFATTIPTDGDGRFEVFDLPFDIQAGQVVTVSQGDYAVKTHDVIDLTITEVDPVADAVSGVGAADTLTYVNVSGGQVTVTSDGTGAWTADVGGEGFDIVPGTTVYVYQADEDWDQTQIDFHVEMEERPGLKTIRANLESYDSVFTFGWQIGSLLTLTIEDPDTPLSPDLVTSQEFSGDAIFFNIAEWIAIEPGQEVSLTDGTTTVDHVVGPLQITSADRATDVVAGIASPGSRVELIPAPGEEAFYVDPEADGTWQIELPAGTLAAADWVMSNQAESIDPDEDSETQYDWYFPSPGMVVAVNRDAVEGFEWPEGADVTLTIDDPDTSLSPDFTANETVGNDPAGSAGNVGFVFADEFDVRPGHVVTLDDGQTLLSHVVQTVEVTNVDIAADTVSGTADPGDVITVIVIPELADPQPVVQATTQPDGTWVASFAGVFDLVPGAAGDAQEDDPDPSVRAATAFWWEIPDNGYVFSGFADPVDNDAMNMVTAGRTVPLKFRVTAGAGDPVIDLAHVAVTVTTLPCELGTAADQIEEYAAGSSGLQNLGDGFYQYNWKTPKSYKNSCKLLTLDIGDGVPHTAQFFFTR